MKTSLVLTLTCVDRPGLVDQLSKTIASHEANWEESRMARLAGRFVGILKLSVASTRRDALVADLDRLGEDGFVIHVEPGSDDDPFRSYRRLKLEVVGNDHEGIIRDIAGVLATHGLNVDELESETVSAPQSGGSLFRARIELRCPAEVSLDELHQTFESLANDLMVDMTLDDSTHPG